MNILNRTALVAATALSLTACDSLLERDPQGDLSSDIIFNDVTGAEAAIIGAYNRVQGPMDDFVIMSEISADYATPTGSFPSWYQVDSHNIPTGNAEVIGQWSGWYALINQTNIILENVANAEGITQARVDQITGEALAMRAYAYHNLARWFGGVPLITQGAVNINEVDSERASLEATYAFILEDLDRAEDLVADARPVGFIDTDVVLAMRARVLLYDGQYDAAAAIAAELYDRYPLVSLEALYDGLNSSESIWELQYNVDDGNSMSFFAFVTGGRREYGPTPQAAAAFDSSGTRIGYNLGTDSDRPIIVKYFRVNTDDDHHFLFRGAEMALIEAEVAARNGNAAEAVAIVNEIRTRAGDPLVGERDGDDADGDGRISADEAFDLVIFERGRELAYEGHRWHDLVRIGEAVARLELASVNDTLWPIPQAEIERNSLIVQNPGY